MPLGEGMVDFPAYLRQMLARGPLPPATVHFEYPPLEMSGGGGAERRRQTVDGMRRDLTRLQTAARRGAVGVRLGAQGGIVMPRDGRELSRREFLAIAGAAASLPLVDRIAPVARQPKRIRIRSVGLDFEREPLIRPTGFKGGYLTELWQPVARLDSDSGRSHIGIGTQSVLWCDPRVLATHSESAGNAMMLAVTDHALQMLVGESFTNPVELLDRIFPEVYAFATRVTGLPNLRRTFALNALVPVDNAAWLLYAAENGIRSFDEMIPAEYRAGLSTRQPRRREPAVRHLRAADRGRRAARRATATS